MASEEEKLRDEIIEFQKARADILRWKLIAIGGVGAAGLSFPKLSVNGVEGTGIVLSLIPIVAAYCDAVGRDLDLRIALISTFLELSGGAFSRYESFVGQVSASWWLMGLVANLGTSLIACVLIFIAGMFPNLTGRSAGVSCALVVSAVLGTVLVVLVEIVYWRRLGKIPEELPPVPKTSALSPAGGRIEPPPV
jgi:hypothetical protein